MSQEEHGRQQGGVVEAIREGEHVYVEQTVYICVYMCIIMNILVYNAVDSMHLYKVHIAQYQII